MGGRQAVGIVVAGLVVGAGGAWLAHRHPLPPVPAASALAAASGSPLDPSLPRVVATVGGDVISGAEVGNAEAMLSARRLGRVGTGPTRRAALRLVAIERAARRAGFAPSAPLARAYAARMGVRATAAVLAGYEEGQLQADLERAVLRRAGVRDPAAAWDAYVRRLVAAAPVRSRVAWWP